MKTELNKYVVGRWLLLAAGLIGIVAFVLATVNSESLYGWLNQYRAALMIGGLFACALPRREQIRLRMQQSSREQGIEPPTTVDQAAQAAKASAASARTRADALRFDLQQTCRFG
jgi:type VI secretion system protein ImpL